MTYVVNREAATLPSNTNQILFEVTGGRVLLHGVFGTVTDAFVGAFQGGFYVFNTTPSQLAVVGVNNALGGVGAGNLFGTNVGGSILLGDLRVVQEGHTIRFRTEDTVTSGEASYTLVYEPLDPGAKVSAV